MKHNNVSKMKDFSSKIIALGIPRGSKIFPVEASERSLLSGIF